jgi:hypothetical protein
MEFTDVIVETFEPYETAIENDGTTSNRHTAINHRADLCSTCGINEHVLVFGERIAQFSSMGSGDGEEGEVPDDGGQGNDDESEEDEEEDDEDDDEDDTDNQGETEKES